MIGSSSMPSLPYAAVIMALLANGVDNFDVQTVTRSGIVWGNRNYLPELNTYIDVYLGVQYAQAPTGDLRYKAPLPLSRVQSNHLGSKTFAPSCPQLSFELFDDYAGWEVLKIPPLVSEDCLYLNVWSPSTEAVGTSKKPVVDWIHGGGFAYGSSSIRLYDGRYLAAWADAVVVSVQYRLGALGFLYTGDDFAPGNAGLKDQVLALRWIRESIEFFGGDKDEITIVGESAGAMSVGYHLLSNETSKLFKRAILMSGTPNVDDFILSPSSAKLIALKFAKSLGANSTDYADVKKCLRNKSWEEMINVPKTDAISFMFRPVIEPPLVPEHPIKLMKKADHLLGKEMIVSWTKDEGSIFLFFELKRLKIIANAAEIPTIDQRNFWDLLHSYDRKDQNIKRQMVQEIYNSSGKASHLDVLIKYYGDLSMICPINQFIQEIRNRGAKVYHAEYNHRDGHWPEWMGVMHGSDLFMLFGYPIHERNFSETDKLMSKAYMDRMKHFVRSGNPNSADHTPWFEDQMFVISSTVQEQDNRTIICTKLNHFKQLSSSGSIWKNLNVFGVQVVFLSFARVNIYSFQS